MTLLLPRIRFHLGAALSLAAFALLTSLASAATDIKLATILPKGLGQDLVITKLTQDWTKQTEGSVVLRRAPGGQKDGEAGIVKKLRSGNYQAALLSVTGLAEIEPNVGVLQFMPLVFRNWEEVDYVREAIRPELEAKLAEKGFVVLFWADAGWVTFFSKKPLHTPDDLRAVRMWVWSGSENQIKMMKEERFQPVGLETDNLHTSLASGMIDAAPVTPIFALGTQVQTVAPNMLDVKWAPIVGAALLRKDVWDAIPAEQQAKLKALCETAGKEIRDLGRKAHDDAVATLRKGPRTTVIDPSAADAAGWEELATVLQKKVRGVLVPPASFDRVMSLVSEYRSQHGK